MWDFFRHNLNEKGRIFTSISFIERNLKRIEAKRFDKNLFAKKKQSGI